MPNCLAAARPPGAVARPYSTDAIVYLRCAAALGRARSVAPTAANESASAIATIVFRIIGPPSTASRFAEGDEDGVVYRGDAAGNGAVTAERDRAHDLVPVGVDLGDRVAGVVGGPHGAGADCKQRRLLGGHRDALTDL